VYLFNIENAGPVTTRAAAASMANPHQFIPPQLQINVTTNEQLEDLLCSKGLKGELLF